MSTPKRPGPRPSASIRNAKDERTFEERREADAELEREVRTRTAAAVRDLAIEKLEGDAIVAAAINGLCDIITRQTIVTERLDHTFQRHNQGTEALLLALDRQHYISERQNEISERMIIAINQGTAASREVANELAAIRIQRAHEGNGHGPDDDLSTEPGS